MKLLPKIQIKERHRHILAMIKKKRGRLILAGLCGLMVSAATTTSAWLLKPVIDDIFISKDAGRLIIFPFMIIAVFFVKGMGNFGQKYFMEYVGQDIIRKLRNQLYNRIQDLPLAFFQKKRTGALMSRITNDVNILKNMVSNAVTSSLTDSFTIIGLTTTIFLMNWRLAILAFIILPAAYFPIFEIGRRVRGVSTGCQKAMAEMNSFLHETIAGIKIVKAFSMEEREKKRFVKKTQKLFALEAKGAFIRALTSPIMEFFAGLGIAFVIWYGGWEVLQDKTTPGTFIAFLGGVLMLYEPVKKLSNLNNNIQQGLAATDRIYDLIETQSEIQDPLQPKPLPDGSHMVSFHDVYFNYGEKTVLRRIDLTVTQGQVLALVGMSGGGKTTLVNLIPRFFDATQGRVCISGIDVRDVTVADLRRNIAIVTQEPILFNRTVRDNIAYGNPHAPEEAIVAAAKAAYAHDFIQRFTKGYNTIIGELGSRLSGGEKQRLCIARALLKNAPILILDEATSSLDTEAESLVQKALDNLMQGRTTFIIAHRLSTVAKADRIVVIVEGQIKEQGTHETLLQQQGEYAKLYDMQFADANDADPEVVSEK